MNGYKGLVTDRFIDINVDEILAKLNSDKKETFIVYLGYDTCAWCNCLVPVLNDVLIEKDMKVYYMDFHADENYNNPEGIFALSDICIEAGFIDDSQEQQIAFSFPAILYIKDGKVVDLHSGTVSGHDASLSELSEKQTARLKYLLEKEIGNLLSEEEK